MSGFEDREGEVFCRFIFTRSTTASSGEIKYSTSPHKNKNKHDGQVGDY